VQQAQQKKKKGRRKRQSEFNYSDGMGDNEDAQPLGSDEDEELDEDGSPIEMTLVNRR